MAGKSKTSRPVAYSYTRFSSSEQEHGDSFRRQAEAARAYADEHDLDLDLTTRFDDAAVSAFRGRNAKSGKLREFMRLVEDGHIAEGSYLLVENLDRISRQDPWDAMPVFQDIINHGITIVTLQDRKVWSKAELKGNFMRIMESLFAMIRAHEESAVKAKRLRAVWAHKRSQAKSTKLSARAPSWLRLSEDRKSFKTRPDRVKVVKRIFKLASEGVGQHRIAYLLNEERVPTFEGGKHWHRSYIAKLLANESVVGTFTPHLVDYESGRRVRRPLDKVRNYYPRIISDELWSQVRALSATPSSLRGRHANTGKLSNLLAGLCKCGRCGATMTLVSKNARDRYLLCTRAKTGAGCKYQSVRYRDVEAQLIEGVDEWLLSDIEIGAEHPDAPKLRQLRSNIEASKEALSEMGRGRTPATRSTIADIEASLERLEAEEKVIADRVSQSVPTLVHKRIDDVYRALIADEIDKLEANRRLKLLIDDVVFDFTTGRVELRWKHGAETSFIFRWPEDE